MSIAGSGGFRTPFEIAATVFSTLLEDQVGRADSLNSVAGILAGLGGVVTTLAGTVPKLTTINVGRSGIAAAGLSVVLAVVGLLTSRPGREPVDVDLFLDRILHSADVTLIEDVLLHADVSAAKGNDERLQHKALAVMAAACALAGAIVLIVIARITLAA